MSTPVKLASALPDGNANGLSSIVSALTETPRDLQVVIAIVDCKKIETIADTGEVVPTARIRRIEAVPAQDLTLAKRLFRRAHDARTGLTALPIEVEDEIRAAFDRTAQV